MAPLGQNHTGTPVRPTVGPRLLMRLLGHSRQRQGGFTLFEALVAVFLTGVILVAITPPLVLSAVARLRLKRVEQGTQIARQQVERVRSLVERGDLQSIPTNLLPPITVLREEEIYVEPGPDFSDPANIIPETSQVFPNSPEKVIGVDIDSDVPGEEFLVQTFRVNVCSTQPCQDEVTNPPVGFILAVRVYTNAARNTARTDLVLNLPQDSNDELFESSIGGLLWQNNRENLRVAPVAVTYTWVSLSDGEGVLCGIRRFRNEADPACQTPG